MADEKLEYLRGQNSYWKQQPTPINPEFGMTAPGQPAAGPMDFLSENEVRNARNVANNQFTEQDPTGRVEGDPGFIERTKTWGASVMASIFDYSDTEEKVKNNENMINNPMDVIETGWDLGVVWPLFKMYERINQAGSYAGAAFPGGIDTLSWDEAGTISPGQVAALNAEVSLTDPTDPANALNLLATGSSLAGIGLAPILGSLSEDGDMLPDDFQNNPEEFLNKQRQEEVFGQGKAQLTSGTYDFIWALVVDPLLFVPAGKAVKFARLRFLDEALKTTDDYTRASASLANDAKNARTGDVALDVQEMSGLGQNVRFVQNASETEFLEFTNRFGNQDIWSSVRGVSRSSFANGSTSRQAMSEAEKFELGTLILRAQGLGDEFALRSLVDSQPGITKLLIQANAVRRARDIGPDGSVARTKYEKTMTALAQELDDSIDLLARAPEGSPAKVQAQKLFEEKFNTFFDVTSSDNPMKRIAEIASLAVNQVDGSAVKRIFGEVETFNNTAVRQITAMANSAEEIISQVSRYNRGLTNATRVGRETALGRANQARRLKNVEKTASVVPLSGSIRGGLSHAYNLGTWNGVKMTLRLWRLPGVERPSGLINLRGLKGADNLREVRAVVFSTRTFSGAPKMVNGDAVGGVDKGEQILAAWLKKYDKAEMDGARGMEALADLERQVAAEIWKFNTVSARGSKKAEMLKATKLGQQAKDEEQLIKAGLEEANKHRAHQQGKLERGTAYWMDGDEIQMIPISDAQLGDSVFMYNFRAFEDSLVRSDASLTARRSAGAVYQAFNDLWRPAVLFRLGYPIRNVGEGLIRASLYEMSFRPILDAFRAGRDGSGNLLAGRQSKTAVRENEVVEQLLRDPKTGKPVTDPAAIRAVRDRKFQKWLKAEIAEAQIRRDRARDTVKEARRVLKEIKEGLPPGTLRQDVEPTMAGIRGSQGLEAADANIPNPSSLLEDAVRVTERKRPGDKGAPQGKFGDNSDFGVEYADFLPTGQVLLTRPAKRKTNKNPGRKKATIVVKTPGNLLGGKGYKFSADKKFTIKEIDEANNTITFTAGSKTFTEPIEIVTGGTPASAAGRLKEVIRANNEEVFARGVNTKGQEAVKRFDDMPDRDLPQVGIARTAPQGFPSIVKDGEVSVDWLSTIPGNSVSPGAARGITGNFDKAKAGSITLEFDTSTGRIFVGEGNHRVAAALDAGVETLPVKIVRRKNISDEQVKAIEKEGGSVGNVGARPEIPWAGGPESFKPEEILRSLSGDVDEYAMNQYREAVQNLDLAIRMEEEMIGRLVAVQNTPTAIRRYAQQRVRKNMQYSSEIAADVGSNIVTALVKSNTGEAFDPGNPFASMATDAASAGQTTRAQLSLDSRINANNLRASQTKEFVDIAYSPRNAEAYFNGQARQLMQLYNGVFGKQVMRAEIEIVDNVPFLTARAKEEIMKSFQTEPGRSAWKFLSGDPNAPWNPNRVRNAKGSNIDTPQQADFAAQSQYLDELLQQFHRLTPSGELRERIKSGQLIPSEEPDFIASVRSFNERTDLSKAQPVIGDMEMLSGTPERVFDYVRRSTGAIFKVIGQMPEDAFVRMPFYGRRYREVFDERVRLAAEAAQANGRQMISGRELGDIVARSHKDALRETKRYLYTIERRTWLGDNFEKIMPFISAGQNAVQAVGRLTSRDPSAAAMIAFLWSRPYASGDIVDENNEISLAWTETLLPGWLKKSGLSDVGIDLGSVNLLFPETGYGLIHRPGPVVTVPASEMMKRGFILKPYAPGAMKALLGDDVSEEVWVQFQKYVFGDSGGPAPSAIRAVMPASVVKVMDLIQGEEGSKAYAYALDSNIRFALAEVQAGDREMPEDGIQGLWDEARDQTNGWFMIRLAFNALAPTSPKLHPMIEPLVDEYRHYQQQYGRDADQLFNETYGPNLAYLGSAKGSRNLAGVDATTEAAERAAKYAGLSSYLAEDIAKNPSMLGIILNSPDPDAEYVYNASVLRQQENQKIPGLSRTYRDMQTPQESLLASSTGAGWTEYLRFRERLNSTAYEMGLESYEDSPDLMYYMKQKRAQMASDPMYAGWYQAYLESGSSRLEGTLRIMRKLTGDNSYALEYAMDPDNAELVNGMQEYLTARDQMLEMERQSGSGLGAEINVQIMAQWRSYIQDLKMRNRVFAAFWERNLYGDMDGLRFEGVSYDSYSEGALNG